MPASPCGAHATAFDTSATAEEPVNLRMGCAKDSGGLRTLAAGDNDLVIALDFRFTERGDASRALLVKLAEETRADQAAGMTLGQALAKRAQHDSVGIYPPQPEGADFQGTVHVVGDSLVFVTPTDAVGTQANWWQKPLIFILTTGVAVVTTAVCLGVFTAGAVLAMPVCGAIAGALAAFFSELLNMVCDGRPLSGENVDKEAWAEIVSMTLTGALLGASGGYLAKWAASAATVSIENIQITMRGFLKKIPYLGKPLGAVLDAFDGMGPYLTAAIQRLQSGVGGTDTPLRVMVVGDSMTQGMEGDWTWRYRLWEWFKYQHVKVDFVGPYRGTKQPDAPVGPPAPPPLQGEVVENPSATSPPVTGAYAQGTAEDFDSDHFAVWGRQAAQDKDLIGPMVAQYKPDLVLLGLGFNDMGWLVSDATGTLDSVKTLVDRARAAKPDIRFAVANVPMRPLIEGRQDLIVKTRQYNSMLQSGIPSWSTLASPVKLVDWEGAYGCDTNVCPGGYDNLHPNALGEFQIARAYERTLHDAYGIGQLVPEIPDSIPRRPISYVLAVEAQPVPSGIKVTWAPVFGARGYGVRYRLAGTAEWNVASVHTNRYDTTWTQADWTWEYQVRVDNGTDGQSVWSSTVTTTAHPETAPPPPNISTLPSSTGMDVYWDPPTGPHTDSIDRYEVITWDKDVPGAYISSTAVTNTQARIDGLVPGHHYLVAVVTWNRAGGGMPAVARSVTVGGGVPPVPTGLTVRSVDLTTVQLSWQGSWQAAGYRVWSRRRDTGGAWQPDPFIADNPERHIAFLFPGYWNFEFCVSAINGNLESDRSPCTALPEPQPAKTAAKTPLNVRQGQPDELRGLSESDPSVGPGADLARARFTTLRDMVATAPIGSVARRPAG
nr:fibronectin type III domain-containing protein [Streptomyces sp. NBC_00974]